MLKRLLAAGAYVAVMVHAPNPVAADNGRDMLALGLSAYDTGAFDGGNELSAGFSAEYRADIGLWYIHPLVGVLVTTDAVVYGYGGLTIDFPVGERFYVSPSFAAGGFDRGSGQNLGHTVEFRTGLELSYRFDDDSRIGLQFHHMSNASLGGSNPGSESVVLNYIVPIAKLFGR